MREDLLAIDRQQLNRRTAIAAQLVSRRTQAQVDGPVRSLRRLKRRNKRERVGLRVVAPAILLEIIDVAVIAPASVVAAGLQ